MCTEQGVGVTKELKSRGRAGGQLLEAIRFARCTVQVLAFASSVRILLCSPYVMCGVYAYWCIVS